MKLCAIQPEYPYTPDRADAAVEYLVDALDRCDESCDLILLPEYSNAPTVFPKGECIPYAKNHTDRLIRAAVDAARRCGRSSQSTTSPKSAGVSATRPGCSIPAAMSRGIITSSTCRFRKPR